MARHHGVNLSYCLPVIGGAAQGERHRSVLLMIQALEVGLTLRSCKFVSSHGRRVALDLATVIRENDVTVQKADCSLLTGKTILFTC